jgi:hypothetical protein
MALNITVPVAVLTDTSNVTSYSLTSFVPTANSFLVVTVVATATASNGTMAGGSLTWTKLLDTVAGSGNKHQVWYAPVGPSPVSTTINFQCTDDAATGVMMIVHQVTGYDTGNPFAQSKILDLGPGVTNPSLTLASNMNTNNAYIAMVSVGRTTPGITVPGGWTEDADTGILTPNYGIGAGSRVNGETGNTIAFTAASGGWSMSFVEINASTGLTQNLSDTITLTDTAAKSVSTSKSDTLTLTDTPSKSTSSFKADTIALNDAVIKAPRLVKADIITLSDSITSRTLGLVKADTITLADARVKSFSTSRADVITLSDALAKTPRKFFEDSIVLTDELSRELGLVKADAIVLTDALSGTVTLNKGDIVTLTDSLSRIIDLSVTDNVTLSDNVSRLIELERQDQVVLTDALRKAFARLQHDDIDITDIISVAGQGQVGLHDSITLTDTKAFRITKGIADTITLLDSLVITLSGRDLTLELGDTISLEDDIILDTGKRPPKPEPVIGRSAYRYSREERERERREREEQERARQEDEDIMIIIKAFVYIQSQN